MAGLTPRLPIALDPDNGFLLIQTYRNLAIQNLTNVLLTSPGERVMDPEFGVGLRKYLFQPNSETTYMDIESRIQNQVRKYLSFIEILRIRFSSPEAPADSIANKPSSALDGNFLGIQISFKIIPLGIKETLNLP